MKSKAFKISKIIREMKNYHKKYIVKINLKRQDQKKPKHIVATLDAMKNNREQALKNNLDKNMFYQKILRLLNIIRRF